MDIVVLLFIVLFVVAAVIIAIVVINMRKRRREAEQEAKQRAEEKKRQQLEEKRRKADEERKCLENEAQQKAKEEEQKRLAAELLKAEEERHKAEEERKRLDEEAQQKAKVQRQMEELRKAEEERPKAEEEPKSLEAGTRHKEEEAQRTEEEEERPKVKAERKPLEPGKRGGRPSGLTQGGEERPAQETKSLRPKTEIGCWKRERRWILGVEVPDDLLEKPELQVLQNGSPLTQDESSEGCWCLEQVCGQVVVQWNEDAVAKETQIALGEGNYLLFKLCGKNQNLGRRVKSPSLGSYLVIVLDNWDRDEALSGPPPAAPEPVSLAGYRAHFFDLEKDGDRKIVFRAPGGESFVIESKASRFELFGTRLNDANEDIGPLFGGRPPKIRTVGYQAWTDVDCIVVIEEGKRSEEKRWRDVIAPDKEAGELGLGDKLEERGAGWYSLRIYDKQLGPPVESLDFRFICALKEIRILQPFPLPSEDDYNIIFTHAHWDHLLGFPFFKPIYVKGTNLGLYGCPFAQSSIKDIFSKPMTPPYFPINLEDLKADISYHGACSGCFEIGSIQVTPIFLSHPNQGIGYKFVEGGKSFVFLTDNELMYKHPGGLDFRDYWEFSGNTDLLIHDAEYTEEEYRITKGWGHTAYKDALRLALEANVKQFGLFHHNQDRSDAALDEIVEDCRHVIEEQNATLRCFAVSAGMEITL